MPSERLSSLHADWLHSQGWPQKTWNFLDQFCDDSAFLVAFKVAGSNDSKEQWHRPERSLAELASTGQA